MKKNNYFFSMLALFLAFGTASFAQGQEPVRSVEYEIGFGSGAAIWLGKSCASFEFKMELRCNLPQSHWDLGMYFAAAGSGDGILYDKANDLYLIENTTYMLPVIDYNWRRGKKISYFVGGGMGMYTSNIDDDIDAGLGIMPRAGVEFFNRLRLTADYKWNIQGLYNYLNFSAGFVFGGGKKKSTEHKQSHKRFKEYEKAQN